jgi:hypothetical protein
MVSMIHGFRVHQNLNRPTSKADERTVNQQKIPILSGEAALHKIEKQFNFGTFFACMYLWPQKHRKHMNSQAYRTTAKVQISSLWVRRSTLVLQHSKEFFATGGKIKCDFQLFPKKPSS